MKRGEVKHSSRGSSRKRAKQSSFIHSAVSSASEEIEQKEAGMQSWIDRLSTASAFHYVSFFVSLAVLAMLFNSRGVIFFAVLTGAAFFFGHFLHRHNRRPHHVIAIIGLFLLPMVLTLAVFWDLFTIVLGVVYLLSVISTIVIFYYHKHIKNTIHDPLKIMWQVTYSKVVSLTVALIVAVILPRLVLRDMFFSFFELSFLWILPSVITFFFFSRFLYLYFFDRKHIRADTLHAVRHAVIYGLAFLVVLLCLYGVFASNAYGKDISQASASLDTLVQQQDSLRSALAKQPLELAQLRVSKELSASVDLLSASINVEKSAVDGGQLSLASLLDDSYVTDMFSFSFSSLDIYFRHFNLVEGKSMIYESYSVLSERLNGTELVGEGFSVPLDVYAAELESLAGAAALPDYRFVYEFLDAVDVSSGAPSLMESQGVYWIATRPSDRLFVLPDIYSPDSIFKGELFYVLKHSVLFRDLAVFIVKAPMLLKLTGEGSFREVLADNARDDSDPLSKAVRYQALLGIDASESQDILERLSVSTYVKTAKKKAVPAGSV